jgi:hypothetical protein
MKLLKLSIAMAIVCAFGASTSAGAAQTNPVSLVSGSLAAKSKSKFTAEQLAEVQARMELANQISHNVEEDARNIGAPESWRAALMNTLLGTHSSVLRDIAGRARTLSDAHEQASQTIKPGRQARLAVATAGAISSSTDNLVYTPMSPCRFIDTRNIGVPMGITPRQFDTEKDGSVYGGVAGCTMPGVGEPAIAANVTLVGPATSAGYLAVRPAGSTNVTSWLNFNQSGPSIAVANQGIITTALNTSDDYAFEAFVVGGPANLVVDYFGYFSAAASTALDCVSVKTSTTLLASSSGSYPAPACPASYTPTTPYCYNVNQANVFSGGSGIYQNPGTSGTTAFCQFSNQNSTSVNVDVGATCCRVVPVPSGV